MKFYIYLLFLSLTIVNMVTYGQDVKKENNTHISFKVFGACEQCKSRIELAIKIKGVKLGVWDVDSKMLTLQYDSALVSLDKIENKIIAVGHDLVNKKAKYNIYKSLPACCHYRELTAEEMTHDQIEKTYKGVVLQEDKKGKFEPLSNASVYWLGTKEGVITDSLGVFSIKETKVSNQLVINYVGFKSDTITIEPGGEVKVILASKGQLNEVTVYSRQLGSYIPMASAIRTQVMTGTELLKAACCNLSESFETNPSVDVSYNDAVTGSKQIQLLGLSGNYTQLTIENLPGPRGLATPLGLNSIAGSWIESIQLTKGVGSVANGYESIAGQINVELKKPETAEKLLGNVYMNEMGKTDVNLNFTSKINTTWSTTLLLHDNFLNNSVDMNNDGFKDVPTGNELSIVNRYKYDNSKGLLGQFGFKVLNDKKLGGEVAFDSEKDKNTFNHYGLSINTERYELFGKMGYVFPQQKYKSIGLQIDAISHQQYSFFGFTNYDAYQKSFYSNLIYQSIIHSTIHKFRTGLSFQYDHYNEDFKNINYTRKEIVPGAFFEYTYTPNEQWSIVAGIRGDDNHLYGTFFTPRVNIRYEPFKGTTIRWSAGRGQRTANIFAENNSVFVSSRQVIINPTYANAAYGLQPEIAWNKGFSIDQKFILFNNAATLGLDFFRNDFDNQVIVDLENARSVQFYNLKGKSYSNSFQAELNIAPIKKLDVRLAYRYFDVKQTYNGVVLERPFIAKNRAFLSIDYATVNLWKFNYTVTYNGKKRIVNTTSNPSIFQLDAYSPSFILMNAQVSKTFSKKHTMDVYLGSENISNIMQKNTIVSASTPFSPYFDASMVWGPTTGRMLYLGWRMKIK